MATSRQNILNLQSEDENTRTYSLNAGVNFGVNAKETIVNAISAVSSINYPASLSRSVSDVILKNNLIGFVSAISLKSEEAIKSFELKTSSHGDWFCCSFNNGQTTVNGQNIRTQGASFLARIVDDGMIINTTSVEYSDLLNKSGLCEFLSSDFSGEVLSKTLIFSCENGDTRVGSYNVTKAGEDVDFSASGFVIDEYWKACNDFNRAEKYKMESFQTGCVDVIDTLTVKETIEEFDQMIKTPVTSSYTDQPFELN